MAARRKQTTAESQAQAEFVSEAEEILERMRDDLGELAEGIDSDADPETINRLFRSAHSLKGLSGMFGQGAMSELAHSLEDILDRLRMGRTVLDRAGLVLFDESVTVAATALEKIAEEGEAPALTEAIADLIGRIEAWNTAPADGEALPPELDVPAPVLRALTEYEEHRLRENLERGRGIYLVDTEFEIAAFEAGLHEIQTSIREIGEVLSTLPSPGGSLESHIRFSLLMATELAKDALVSRLDLSPEAVVVARAPRTRPAPPPIAMPEEDQDSAVLAGPAPPGQEEARAPTGTLKSISETVRVDIRKLDELMNLVGELAIQRAALHQIASKLLSDLATQRIGTELEKLHEGLERKLQELQAGVLEVRMVPLRQVFDKLSRVARRLRLDLDKEVRLEIQGADTELDKLLIEELVDPLMHLVRNAFDHAIETAEEREVAGKPPEGVIRIVASQRGNDVVIAVADDGRGIDSEGVRRRAVEVGLIDAESEINRKEVLDLIFHPGLSTREEVTETSGRGVGMDVVRANIRALGGLVDIQSVEGQGTTITITLPITLAIIQALIVGVGEHRFAIPLNSIRETLLVDPAELQRTDGRELMNLRGDALPLCRLADEFELDVPEPGKSYVVVLSMGDTRLGLRVDRLEGQQDVVIKPIQGPVASVRGIAGATELGDLGAVLVLDVSALVEDVVRKGDGS